MDLWQHLAARRRNPAPQAVPNRRSEVQRIIDLPKWQPKAWTGDEVRKRQGLTLRPIQQKALAAIKDAGGGLLPIGVGHGKTYIALLAGAALDAKLVILLTPPRTVEQVYAALANTDNHFRIPRTEVVPYSMLSRPNASDLLRRLVEGVEQDRIILVADEAHNLKRHTAARTKRVARFLDEFPRVRFVAMSGTLTAKSILDFAHLSEWALRGGSPLPRPSVPQGAAALQNWAAAIDADGRPASHNWDWCQPLWDWYGHRGNILAAVPDERKEGVRKAFQTRLSITKGVVTTEESSFGASLYLEKLKFIMPPEVFAAMDKVEQTKCKPDGEPIESPVDQWRILRQLSLGFWYRWKWPNDRPDHDWLMARAAWARHVRAQLDNHAAEHYDSPLLVFNRVAREHTAGQRAAIHRAWEAWCAVKDRPAPPVEAVWITDKVIDTALRPVLQDKVPTIVWYSDDAVADALAKRGMEVVRAGKPVPKEARTVCLSVKSHGTGLNLQAWSQNLVLTPTPSGLEWEQLIGRTHRSGQEADEVWVSVLAHTEAFREALKNAMRDAEYLQHSTGQAQKLLLACQIEK
jgi:hypothetical protein